MNDIINLQNTPLSDRVQTEAVEFSSQGQTLRGTLYRPVRTEPKPQPAVLVTGAWTSVKEQMPGTYARELAERGFTCLAFDFRGWGESSGDPRFVEDPAAKTEDIRAAADYMASREEIDAEHLYGLGICASAGYMAQAVAEHPRLSKLALVAPWLHDPELAQQVYGGKESANTLIASSEVANPKILTAASTSDETAPMYQAPYYTEPNRGLIDAYDNKFSARSWKPWLSYNALASAPHLQKPILMVGSAGMALPAGAAAYEQATSAPLKKLWLADEVTQFDFYDRKPVVTAAVDAVADFYKE